MQEGILNEPTREAAERLAQEFGAQMGLKFTNLMFVAVADDGTFRTANYAKGEPLPAEAVRMIADHLKEWADRYEQLQQESEQVIEQTDLSSQSEDDDEEEDVEDDDIDDEEDEDEDEDGWSAEIPDRI